MVHHTNREYQNFAAPLKGFDLNVDTNTVRNTKTEIAKKI